MSKNTESTVSNATASKKSAKPLSAMAQKAALAAKVAIDTSQKDALVYTLKYALRHFAETGEL